MTTVDQWTDDAIANSALLCSLKLKSFQSILLIAICSFLKLYIHVKLYYPPATYHVVNYFFVVILEIR